MANNAYRAVDWQGGNQNDVYDQGWSEGNNEGILEGLELAVAIIEELPQDTIGRDAALRVLGRRVDQAKAQVRLDDEGLGEYE